MLSPPNDEKDELFKHIKLLSNENKYKIVKITQKESKNISELSKELKLAYNKVSDYVAQLEKDNLVLKVKEGKAVYVKSNVELSKGKVTPKKHTRHL